MAPLPLPLGLLSTPIHTTAHLLERAPTTLLPRQVVAIPATYSNLSGPSAGQIVGIVLGSVAGFILLIWLLYTTCGVSVVDDSTASGSVVVRPRRKSSSAAKSRRHSSVGHRDRVLRAEVREVRREGPGVVPVPVVERIVVEEERRERSRRGSGPSRRSRSSSASTGDLDEVVVIEDHTPPRRSKSRRESGGYRNVDPMAYGGGDGRSVR